MPVDVYGLPNKIQELKEIIGEKDIKLIIDKSHSFGVEIGNISSLGEGDYSFASMHATKVMSSIEGGIICSAKQEFISKFENYCNFGFTGDDSFSFGTNAKIDELRCLFGRCVLSSFKKRREKRKKIFEKYKKFGLTNFLPKSLKLFERTNLWNYSYLPILLPSNDREKIYQNLLSKGIFTKKYFNKLIPDYISYKSNDNLWTSNSSLLLAREISKSILTLPFYSGLSNQTIKTIVSSLNNLDHDYGDYIRRFL